MVFHYDESQQAIVAWSTSSGRVQKRGFSWSEATPGAGLERPSSPRHPAWSISLEGSTLLDDIVPLDQIARIQWDLFPALQAFEDMVGAPLYYPFAMGNPSETRLLEGYVFKLPALFVKCFPSMARIAESAGDPAARQARAAEANTTASSPAREPGLVFAMVDRVWPGRWDSGDRHGEHRRRAQ